MPRFFLLRGATEPKAFLQAAEFKAEGGRRRKMGAETGSEEQARCSSQRESAEQVKVFMTQLSLNPIKSLCSSRRAPGTVW